MYQPERNTEATKKYREMLTSPGGVPGALRRKAAEDVWKKWQDVDKNK